VGEFCKENNFKHLHKLVIKLLGGKLGNAQTWCTTIHEGNLERVHKEDGAKNNIEQNSISNWHSFFIHTCWNHEKFIFTQHMGKPIYIQNYYLIFGFMQHKKIKFHVGVITCSWFLMYYPKRDWTPLLVVI